MRSILNFTIKELEPLSFHPLITGELNKKNITLIIDTGASRTVLSNKLTDGFQVISSENEEAFAAGINAERFLVEQVKVDLITIGGTEFRDLVVFSTNLDAISSLYEEMVGHTIDGLIGCDFLLQNKAIIDFSNNTITVNKSG